MSYSLTQKAIDTEGIPLAAKAVLVVLARHAKDDGTNKKCPSVQTIADKAGMCGKAARNGLRWLEGEGWIKAVGNKVGGRKQTTNYVILIGRLGPDETRNEVPPIDAETRHHVPPNGHDTRHHVPSNAQERRHDVPLNPAPRSAEYVMNKESLESASVESSPPACVHVHAREVAGRVATMSTVPATDKNKKIVEEWIARGADPDLDIIPAVAEVLETTRVPHDQIRGFSFFADAVENRTCRRLNPPHVKAANNVVTHPATRQYREPSGRATGRTAAFRYLARIAEEGD